MHARLEQTDSNKYRQHNMMDADRSVGASLFVRGVDMRAGVDATICNLGRHDARSLSSSEESRRLMVEEADAMVKERYARVV
jgi:hypothetical protein